MNRELSKLATVAEATAMQLRAAGEEHWCPILAAFAARLREGDPSAAGELLRAIESPGGLAEFELTSANATYVSDAGVMTLNRRIRKRINHLNLLVGLAVPGSRWHPQGAATDGGSGDDDQLYELQDVPPEPQGGHDLYSARGIVYSRAKKHRAGQPPSASVDWLRVGFRSLCGAVAGGVVGLLVWHKFTRFGRPSDNGFMIIAVIGGAAIGGVIGAVKGLTSGVSSSHIGQDSQWWMPWWWPWR